MKTTLTLIAAIILPGGLILLAAAYVGSMLARHRHKTVPVATLA